MSSAERLISSDDRVDLAHPAIKECLAKTFHPAYDAALGEPRGPRRGRCRRVRHVLWGLGGRLRARSRGGIVLMSSLASLAGSPYIAT